jgi:hypothetical protein
MYDQDIVDLIRERLYDGKHNDRLEKPMTVRKIAKFKGYHCGKKQVWDKRSRRLARTITNKIELLDSSSEELESSNIVPLDIKDLARKWSTL